MAIAGLPNQDLEGIQEIGSLSPQISMLQEMG